MAVTDGLIAFLNARLDEDERRAKGSPAEGRIWRRALREVEAKRAILELHKPDRDPADEWYGHDVRCEECGGVTGSPAIGERGFNRSWPCSTLRYLIAIWSGHLDYRQEWAPRG